MYESAMDLAREHDIMQKVSAAWGVQYYKLPISYRLDFILMSAEKPKAFVECKHRNFAWGDYPDVMISMSKVMVAEQMLQITGLRTMFVIRAKDQILYTQLNLCASNVDWLRFGGRTANTRDDGDVEPVYHIPAQQFSMLGS